MAASRLAASSLKPCDSGPVTTTGLPSLKMCIRDSASPAVVHRARLEEALWRDSPPDSDSLRTHIHQIRHVVDKPFATPLLHTVHGIGYQLRAVDDA